MVHVMLLMIVGGIGLTGAVSDPKQVTLRWLRLGGLIAVSLLAVEMTVSLLDTSAGLDAGGVTQVWWLGVGLASVCVAQLVVVQLGYARAARLGSMLVFYLAGLAVVGLLADQAAAIHPSKAVASRVDTLVVANVVGFGLASSALFATGLLGGFLMTMLLGHAYLTAGNEMTQSPFRRLVWMLAALLALRAVTSGVFGLWPYFSSTSENVMPMARMWDTVMVTARYAVGVIVPGVFVYMIHDCVRRRANQSATGILYVATVLVVLGEGIALALLGSTGYVF